MSIPSHYSNMTLAEFLEHLLRAYPGLDSVIELLSDRNSDERKTFHILMLSEHTGLMHVSQYGKTWQIARVSNIRGSNGYTEYTFNVWNKDVFEFDNATIAYRLFRKQWEEWVTLIIS